MSISVILKAARLMGVMRDSGPTTATSETESNRLGSTRVPRGKGAGKTQPEWSTGHVQPTKAETAFLL